MSDAPPLRLAALPADDRPADGNRPTVEPLLLSARDLAVLLGVSLRSVRSMDRAGKLPRPLRLSPGCVRWRRAEIFSWIAAGAPCRQVWERIRNAHK